MKLSSRVPSLRGCLSERLNCPAVTTQISISLTRTHAPLARPCYVACLLPRIRVYGERVRVTTDTREIWICGDIDQVERGRGEDLVLERDLASVESRRSQLPLSLHLRSFIYVVSG